MTRHAQRVAAGILSIMALSETAVAQIVERDLPYGPDPKRRLDLSIPVAKAFPTVIFVHGGSLTTGDKADDDYQDVCLPFPAVGIACANINYRLAPAHPWPAQGDDVAAAVAWVRTNIGARGGDPRSLFLIGHSSGAMLVALVGADQRYLARHGLKTSDLCGIVPMGSIMWDDELEQAIARYGRSRVEVAFRRDPDNAMYRGLDAYLDHWPIRHVRTGMPPYLFLIAESEQAQPPVLKTNSTFVARALALGNWAEYRVLPGRTHYSAIRKVSEPGDPVFAMIRDFIRQCGGSVPK